MLPPWASLLTPKSRQQQCCDTHILSMKSCVKAATSMCDTTQLIVARGGHSTLVCCWRHFCISLAKSSNGAMRIVRQRGNVDQSRFCGKIFLIRSIRLYKQTSLQELMGSFKSTRNLFTYHAHTSF